MAPGRCGVWVGPHPYLNSEAPGGSHMMTGQKDRYSTTEKLWALDDENYLPSPEHCRLQCYTDGSVCGHIKKCSYYKQLDTLVTRRTATINKRCSVYNTQPIEKDAVKQLILNSIESGFKCNYCGETLQLYTSRSDFRLAVSIDHIIPLANRGDNSEGNLIITCTRCNLVKGTMKEKHFLLFLKTLYDAGGKSEVLEWLEDAYQHALAYKIERSKVEGVY